MVPVTKYVGSVLFQIVGSTNVNIMYKSTLYWQYVDDVLDLYLSRIVVTLVSSSTNLRLYGRNFDLNTQYLLCCSNLTSI